ncbi:PKD domain-containing protein, partial [uncultured Winogradskyella sp.]|uniref:PKD domain-containing protein n=1 Tax=uncultured Winogradskyella sp. TaxID=395353 RepID=UPI002614225D
MKYIITILALLCSSLVIGQDVLMQTATVSQCGGVFYDSGGEFGPYGNDESFVLTICPENAEQKVQIDFTEFSTQLNADVMTIYNGDVVDAATAFGSFSGVDSPGLVTATAGNASGCLTIEFVSNDNGNTTGWVANISCLTPCQTITSQIDTYSPTPNGDGYIRVCPNEEITLTGSGNFSLDGTGASYQWDLGDGNTVDGQTATFSYDTPGVYIVNLNINDTNTTVIPEGCSNTNLINQVIQVATEPDFTGTEAAGTVFDAPSLCFGESTTISGVVNAVEFINDCTPPASGTTVLPDQSGATYETSITVDCYDSNQTLTDVNQIVEICINMEHSWSNDLEIDIISPSGQVAQLYDRGGGGTYFGGANNLDNQVPGIGADYCFSLSGSVLLNQGPTITAGSNPPSASWTPGTYLPVDNFSSLLGSPLNGDWTIRVVDNLTVDDGTIFSWVINFDPNLQPPELSFTPVITSEAWDADPTITSTSGNDITVLPDTAGQHCYTYRVMDDFGCEYTEVVCFDVYPEIVTEAPSNLYLCDTGIPPYIFDLESNTSVILANTDNSTDYVVTYHNSFADAEADASAITNTSSYSGVDLETIHVRVEYLDTDCYEILSFTLNVAGQPTINPVSDLELCDDSSNDGFEEFDLSTQTALILGSQSSTDFTVSYHLNFEDA